MRRRVADARQAEAYLVLLLAGLAVGWLTASFAVRGLLLPEAGGWLDPWWLGLIQAGGLVLLGLAGGAGFAPAIRVACRGGYVYVRQGGRTERIACAAIRTVETVPARVFHRHHRRYAATRTYAGRLQDDVLLLHTAGGPVALGLAAADRAALEARLRAMRARAGGRAEAGGDGAWAGAAENVRPPDTFT